MLSALGASVDRRIADAILARARRRWLPLQLVPATLTRPLALPAATVIRRKVSRTLATTAATVAVVVALVLIVVGS